MVLISVTTRGMEGNWGKKDQFLRNVSARLGADILFLTEAKAATLIRLRKCAVVVNSLHCGGLSGLFWPGSLQITLI